MKEFALLFFAVFASNIIPGKGQVKSEFLYNSSSTRKLDLRTTVSANTFYYLKEGETFSFRESAPGVKTKSYKSFTKWDSSPYRQGHLRYRNGSSDRFVMNYRLLPPLHYNDTLEAGYPLIVLLHGGIERANCSFHNCYHSTWAYDPNINAPKASTSATHPLLNNDHHLKFGGEEHLAARNLAGSLRPDDPNMPARAFPGFVLAPQMFNDWDEESVQHMLRLVQLHISQYNIDPNKVYVHGLSVGGFAVYDAISKAPWLFAAAIPICAAKDTEDTANRVTKSITNIPIWIFQGAADLEPSVATTKALMDKWKSLGGSVKYTEYQNMDHSIWNTVYSEPEFFSWLRQHDKANVHISNGNTTIIRSKKMFPHLVLSEGFHAYQWEKDGKLIDHGDNELVVSTPGVYRARFSRVPAPSVEQWNKWSPPVMITESTGTSAIAKEEVRTEQAGQRGNASTTVPANRTVNEELEKSVKQSHNAAGL
jgi:predicted esterase